MENKLKAIQILNSYSKLLLNQTDLEIDELNEAVREMERIEHYSHYTNGCWATDRPDLFKEQINDELMFKLDFWGDENRQKGLNGNK